MVTLSYILIGLFIWCIIGLFILSVIDTEDQRLYKWIKSYKNDSYVFGWFVLVFWPYIVWKFLK